MAIIDKIPTPQKAQSSRLAPMLECNQDDEKSVTQERRDLNKSVLECDVNGPVVAFIAKMFVVDKRDIARPTSEANFTKERRDEVLKKRALAGNES